MAIGEKQFEKIFTHSSEGLIVCNAKSEILFANNSALRIFQYDEDELTNKPIETLIPRKSREVHKSHMKGYMKAPASRKMGASKNLMALRKDGSEFPVEISLSYYHENKELFAIAMVVDISVRVELENKLNQLNKKLEEEVKSRTKELEDQYQLLKAISENFPNGNIYVLDSNHNIVWCDGEMLRKGNFNLETLNGQSFTALLPDELKKEIANKLAKAYEGNEMYTELFRNDKYISLTAAPLNKKGNATERIVVVESDISVQKRIELELEQNLQKEKELNELKSRFVSMASHEFRTPLASIVSSASLIEKYKTSEQQDKRDKHISRIKKSVSNLTGILNDFLSVDKLDTGKLEPVYTEFNLSNLLDEVIEEVKVSFPKDHQFNIEMDEKHHLVTTDKSILNNILINLTSNASKYSENGKPIDIAIKQVDNNYKMSIQDYGIGIPNDEIDQLFTRFFRAKNVTNIDGTGLGLNIVKKYLELLGGSITCESELGVGTKMTIIIPNQINHE